MTIKDIAEISGYGVGTVSRVLNNHPGVSKKTREKILKVMEEQDFQPNENARHLKQQFSSSIAIVVKGTQNLLFAEILEKIQPMFSKMGESTFVTYLREERNEVKCAAGICRERNPKALIFLGGNLEFFEKYFSDIKIPSVLVTNNAREMGFQNLSSIFTDDEKAAEEATNLLVEQGHKNIGIIGGSLSGTQISFKRFTGSRKGLLKHKLQFSQELNYESCRFSMDAGYEAAQKLLAKSPDVTGIFAMSDIIAMGVIRAIKDLGKDVPEDISVVGYDGVPMSYYTCPRLTTIRQDTEKMAKMTVELIMRGISSETESVPVPVHKVIPFSIIKGESIKEVR